MSDKNTAVSKQSGLKAQIDTLLETRQYVIDKIIPILTEGQDFYLIRDKKSLGKPGAEKLASIFSLIASFEVDKDTMELLKQNGLVAYVCNVVGPAGERRGQGRGADTLSRNGSDANKTIKMAQKRAFVDAVIRATGLSDIFTQDLEDMDPAQISAPRAAAAKKDTPIKRMTLKAETVADDMRWKCHTCEKEATPGKPQCYECWSAGISLTKEHLMKDAR